MMEKAMGRETVKGSTYGSFEPPFDEGTRRGFWSGFAGTGRRRQRESRRFREKGNGGLGFVGRAFFADALTGEILVSVVARGETKEEARERLGVAMEEGEAKVSMKLERDGRRLPELATRSFEVSSDTGDAPVKERTVLFISSARKEEKAAGGRHLLAF